MLANIQSRSPATASPGRLCMKPEIRGISGEFGDSTKLLELLRQLTSGPPRLRFYTNGVFQKANSRIQIGNLNGEQTYWSIFDLDLIWDDRDWLEVIPLQSVIGLFLYNRTMYTKATLPWWPLHFCGQEKFWAGWWWRDSGKSCTGWQWAKLEEERRASPLTICCQMEQTPASTLTFTPFLMLCYDALPETARLNPNIAIQFWERSGSSSAL